MGSSSGTSSGSSLLLQTSVSPVSDENLRKLMELRKRTESNRESARRSRMKKQQRMESLTAEVARLRRENERLVTMVELVTRVCLRIEGENSVLGAQVIELSSRLEGPEQIVDCLSGGNGYSGCFGGEGSNMSKNGFVSGDEPWSCMCWNQPVMASAEMLQY